MRSGLSYLAAVGACLIGLLVSHDGWARPLVCVVACVYGIWRLVRPLWREAQRPDVKLCKRCRSEVIGSELDEEAKVVSLTGKKVRLR